MVKGADREQRPRGRPTARGEEGAGFAFGVDDGIDPPTNAVIDQGLDSQLRILGIGADPTTGQARVPVIITSFHDSSIPRTINGVDQSSVIDFPAGTTAPTPKAGDGGVIFFGGVHAAHLQRPRHARGEPDRQRRHQLHHADRARGGRQRHQRRAPRRRRQPRRPEERRPAAAGQRPAQPQQRRDPVQRQQGGDDLQLEPARTSATRASSRRSASTWSSTGAG